MKRSIFGPLPLNVSIFVVVLVVIVVAGNSAIIPGKSGISVEEVKSRVPKTLNQQISTEDGSFIAENTKDLEKLLHASVFLMALHKMTRTKRSIKGNLRKKDIPSGMRKAGKGTAYYPASIDPHDSNKERKRLRQLVELRKLQEEEKKKKAENAESSSSSTTQVEDKNTDGKNQL